MGGQGVGSQAPPRWTRPLRWDYQIDSWDNDCVLHSKSRKASFYAEESSLSRNIIHNLL